MKIALCCNGGNIPEIGLGHLSRCLRIAGALSKEGHSIYFVTSMESMSPPMNFMNCHIYQTDDYEKTFTDIKPDIIVIDMLNTELGFMEMAKRKCRKLISLDDKGTGAAIADFTINGNVCGGTYNGAEYVIVHPDVVNNKAHTHINCKTIFISFGGYDHLNLKAKTLDALSHIQITKVIPTPTSYARLLKKADIAITNGGLTMFDAMAAGVPTISIAQYEHQEEVAKMYPSVKFLGHGNKVRDVDIHREVWNLACSYKERRYMSLMSKAAVDGKGLERVVKLILGDVGWRK